MQAAINEIKRPTPFLLGIGTDLSVVTAGSTFMLIGDNSTEALLVLAATHYVFDVHYSEFVKPTWYFIQVVCLDKCDDSTDLCNSLAIFLKLYETEKKSAAPMSSESESSN